MGLFNQFPFTSFDRLNLDALMRYVHSLDEKVTEYLAYSTITYADPLDWNITSQYVKNTVVVDALSGNAYLSVQPVPTGILITNTDYWTPIGNFSALWGDIKNSLTSVDLETTAITPQALHVNDLFWYANELYIAIAEIAAGSAIVVGTNANKVTVDEIIKSIRSLIAANSTAISEVADDIAEEATAREDSDAVLDGRIDTLDSRVTAVESYQYTVKLDPYTVTPSLLGETVSNSSHSGVCKVGDVVYVLDRTMYDSNGTVKAYNMTSNSLIMEKTIKVGDGASMCYNSVEQAFYIAPVQEYSAGTGTEITKIYKYDGSFTTRSEIETPAVMRAVSYDYNTGKLYAAEFSSNFLLNIYEVSGTTFTLVKALDCANLGTGSTLTDVAVFTNDVYVATIERNVCAYDIVTGEVLKLFHVANEDTGEKYYLGGLRGFEFDSTGELIAVNNFELGITDSDNGFYDPSLGFVTHIPTKDKFYHTTATVLDEKNVVYIQADYGTRFTLAATELKGLEFIAAYIHPVGYYSITGGATVQVNRPFRIINKNVSIEVLNSTTLEINQTIYLADGIFGILVFSGSTLVSNLASTAATINMSTRVSVLYLRINGTSSGTGISSTKFIDTGYFNSLCTFGNLNGFASNQIGVNGTMIPRNTACVGAVKLATA